MDKSPEAFRTISEVSEALETPAHVLRFWESRFPQIRPVKRAGGRRYYRPSDIALLSGIKRLLHDEGMTIRGVQKILREQGIRHVSGLLDEVSPEEEALEAAMAGRLDHEDATTPAEAAAATAEALEAALQALPRDGLPGTVPDNVIAFPIEADLPKTDPQQFHFPGFDPEPEIGLLEEEYPQTEAAPDAATETDPTPVEDAALTETTRYALAEMAALAAATPVEDPAATDLQADAGAMAGAEETGPALIDIDALEPSDDSEAFDPDAIDRVAAALEDRPEDAPKDAPEAGFIAVEDEEAWAPPVAAEIHSLPRRDDSAPQMQDAAHPAEIAEESAQPDDAHLPRLAPRLRALPRGTMTTRTAELAGLVQRLKALRSRMATHPPAQGRGPAAPDAD